MTIIINNSIILITQRQKEASHNLRDNFRDNLRKKTKKKI